MKKLMKMAAKAAAVAVMSAGVGIAAVGGLPFKKSAAHEYADKIYGRGSIEVDASGKGKIVAFFSSGKKFSGEKRLGMTARILSKDGPIAVVPFTVVLPDPVFHGGNVERVAVHNLNMAPAEWATVTDVTFSFEASISKAECEYLKEKAAENPHFYFPSHLC